MVVSAALAPLFGAAAGGAATAGIGATIVGGVLSGAAAGWMQKSAADEEEERYNRERERRTDANRGLAGASKFWNSDMNRQRQAQEDQPQAGPATPETPQNTMGQPQRRRRPKLDDKYRKRAERNKTRTPKYKYNRATGQIEHS